MHYNYVNFAVPLPSSDYPSILLSRTLGGGNGCLVRRLYSLGMVGSRI